MVARKRVVVVDDGYESYEIERSILAAIDAEVVVVPCNGDAEAVIAAVAGADAVLVRESPVRRGAIDAMPGCRAIVRYGIGVDNVDLEHAREKGIVVANVPDYGIEEVSDHALALLLTVARRTATRDRAVRAGAWNVSRAEPMLRIQGKTLGLIGYGRIARALECKLRAIGVARVLVADPQIDAAAFPEIELVDADTVFRESDYLSLHAPRLPSTYRIADAARIASMKRTAILVNTARGGLIDEHALARALKAGAIFGAGIDVFEDEPVGPAHPLFDCDNAILTDHTAWYSEESVAELQRKAAEEVRRVLSGEAALNQVNRA